MIRVVNLTQHYGIKPVLRDVSFEIPAGELAALMGPNGMGKSTLLGSMAGILSPQRGYVEIDGLRRRSTPENELTIRKKTVYLPDNPWLPPYHTGREYLLAIGNLYEIDETRLVEHIEELGDIFELADMLDAPTRSYSNGQKKKLAVCGVLVTEAKVLLLDEPFSGGLDPSALAVLKRIMTRLAEREDMTVVMATPVPELVEQLAHRVLILRNGEVAACDTPDALRRQLGEGKSWNEILEEFLTPGVRGRADSYLERH